MSKRLKIRKNGQRVYEIRVSRGRDPLTGKQLTPYQMIPLVGKQSSEIK